MRLNIILLFLLFWVNTILGQIVINEQKFDRSKLEFHVFLENKGTQAVQIEAIGIASSYVTLDVCDRAEKTIHLSESHTVDFEVDRPETIRNLLRPLVLKPGEEKGLVIRASPLPESICDYWEADIRGIIGLSNMQKCYSEPVTITEDDYYNFNDWLDQMEKKKGQQFTFKPDRLSRLQLVDWLKSANKDNILKALHSFNEFFWPSDEKKQLLQALFQHPDTLIRNAALLAGQQQQQKLAQALQVLQEPDNFSPGRKKEAVEGLGLAQYQAAVPILLDFWKADKEMEPHLIARTLIQIEDEGMLPDLLYLAQAFKKSAEEQRGFSHDRWKWLTVSALLAHYGYPKALPVLEDCIQSVLNNFEYPELRLIMEALGRSEQEEVKTALNPFYKEAMKVNFSDDFTLAVLPLYLEFGGLEKTAKASVLEPYLRSDHFRLQLEAIRMAGDYKLDQLRPVLEEQMNLEKLWEKRFYLFKSLEQLKK